MTAQALGIPSIVVAAAASGAGKTTLALGLMAALRDRGLVVQAAKVGPDYIDTAYHARTTGRPSRNLDTWLANEAQVRASFARACVGADVAVIEGVMGLFDGRHGEIDAGSTAHLARTLGAPVLVAIDCAKSSATAAAVAWGLLRSDCRVEVAGAILNRVASDRHEETIRAACRRLEVPVLGVVRKNPGLALPSRHLGLCPAPEGAEWRAYRDAAAQAVRDGIDLTALLARARSTVSRVDRAEPTGRDATRVRIGIARDEAFSFYYESSLDALRDAGAELVPFSPLRDAKLPAVDALYLGGGYPEMHARELAANDALFARVRAAAASGMPIYAECGALMWLCREIVDLDGGTHAMAGLLDATATMSRTRAAVGYVEMEAIAETPMVARGMIVRGHEFHFSRVDCMNVPIFRSCDGDRLDGFAAESLHASYVHLDLGAAPELARRFVASARTRALSVRPAAVM